MLVVELCSSHGEVLCGMVQYMLDLGYSVDALIDTQLFLDNALDIGFDDRVRVCATSVTNIKIILSTKWIKQYEFVFFNTLIVYQNPRISILCLAPYHQPKNGFLAIEHNTQAQYARILPPHRILTLMPTPHYRFYANAHYFGKHAKQGKHTQNPSFLIVGKISKNLQPTLDVFRQLAHHASFDLFIIGGYDQSHYDLTDLKDHIHFTGYLTYPQLYGYANKAHFILPLLDAHDVAHNRYLYDFSGSLGLSYGFGIIPIIHRKFAPHFLLNQDNALIYDDMLEILCQALRMPASQIQSKALSLHTLAKHLHTQSLAHITQALQTPCPTIHYPLSFRIKAFLKHRYWRLRRYGKLLFLIYKSLRHKSEVKAKTSYNRKF